MITVVLGFDVPPTAKVIQKRDLGLKSHPKDWRSPGSNSRPLVYKASSLTTTPRRLLDFHEHWYVAQGTWPIIFCLHYDSDDLDLFYGKVKFWLLNR